MLIQSRAIKRSISIAVILSIAFFGTKLDAQAAPTTGPHAVQVAEYCHHVANGNEQATALEKACEFSLSVQQKLPNYICDERIKRWARNGLLIDVIDTQVTVENGRDSYSNIRINGRVADKMLPRLPGILTAGEFGMQLPLLFAPENNASFKFKKEVKLSSRPAFLFSFEIREGDNKSFNVWDLKGEQWNPGYTGSIWVDKRTLRPVQLEMSSSRVPFPFVFQTVAARTRYGEIALRDGSTFLLPITSSAQACDRVWESSAPCLRNDLTFTNCRKFGATTQILSVQ